MRENTVSQPNLRHNHPNLSPRYHSDANAERLGFAEAQRTQSTTDELRYDCSSQKQESQDSRGRLTKRREVHVEPDARQEERHQKFRHTLRKVALPRAGGFRQS